MPTTHATLCPCTPLGQVLLGRRAGREHADHITKYKAMCIAMEDLLAAELAYHTALARGVGTRVAL